MLFVEQSEEAIAAGAFHNDVVAVANERVLFAHELAFADKTPLIDACSARIPGFEYVEVAASDVPLEDATPDGDGVVRVDEDHDDLLEAFEAGVEAAMTLHADDDGDGTVGDDDALLAD